MMHYRIWGLGVLAACSEGTPSSEPDPVSQTDHETTLESTLAGSTPASGTGAPTILGYYQDRILLQAGDQLDEVANDHGLVIQTTDIDWVTAIVPNSSLVETLAALRADSRVVGVGPMGQVQGVGVAASCELCSLAWHLDDIEVPTDTPELEEWVVAVLDSGVAYEDHQDSSGTYVQAETLVDVQFVHPWDFVNDDAHPNDDHQHGTHITSVIASEGALRGVAPGVSIMPIKVLDHTNAGSELALIQGIHHAVDHGADVINMSLSFTEGYRPSSALAGALSYASDAGVVLVAASGNSQQTVVTYPAADPRVIAVTASDFNGEGATYGNRSPRVDIAAPGGDLNSDQNEDGYIDGIVGETIEPGDPGQTGFWFYAGTSQAAAVTSGAVVHLLDAGHPSSEVLVRLQQNAQSTGPDSIEAGMGTGVPHLTASINAGNPADPASLGASLLPFLAKADGGAHPSLLVTLVDGTGEPVTRATAYGTVSGSTSSSWSCRTDDVGQCIVQAAWTDNTTALAWAFTLEAVEEQGSGPISHPEPAMFLTDALELVVAAMAQEPTLDGASLAIEWSDTDDVTLGPIQPAIALVDGSTQAGSLPTATLLNHLTIDELATSRWLQADLDGTGLATSPMGLMTVRHLLFQGDALPDNPMGLSEVSVTAIDGTGLATSPIGFHATDTYGGTGGPFETGSLGLDGQVVFLQQADQAELPESHVADALSSGGWTSNGYGTASLLVASSIVERPASTTGSASGAVDAGF